MSLTMSLMKVKHLSSNYSHLLYYRINQLCKNLNPFQALFNRQKSKFNLNWRKFLQFHSLFKQRCLPKLNRKVHKIRTQFILSLNCLKKKVIKKIAVQTAMSHYHHYHLTKMKVNQKKRSRNLELSRAKKFLKRSLQQNLCQ